jgi:hypothetical protein
MRVQLPAFEGRLRYRARALLHVLGQTALEVLDVRDRADGHRAFQHERMNGQVAGVEQLLQRCLTDFDACNIAAFDAGRLSDE